MGVPQYRPHCNIILLLGPLFWKTLKSSSGRTELGKAGRENRGIFRVHQFEKVEQFCITAADPEMSREMHPESSSQEHWPSFLSRLAMI